MDENSKQLIEDCFLRPVSNSSSTSSNVPVNKAPTSRNPLKTELQVLRLTDDSQKMVMETLKNIHGPDFELNSALNYKEMRGKLKKTYWEDRGTLVIQSITNYSIRAGGGSEKMESNEERLRRYAILKLQSYGFHENHCAEAFDHCESKIDDALELLYNKYMKFDGKNDILEDYVLNELPQLRSDEKEVLESIYDKSFEEREKDSVWLLKFNISYLLKYSPSELKKKLLLESAGSRKTQSAEKPKMKCRNYLKNQTCRFGTRCRFSHDIDDSLNGITTNKAKEETDTTFYLEIRFRKNCQYPHGPPIILLKSDCHDIPKMTLLKISKRLFLEAQQLALDVTPSIYPISQLLQFDEEIIDQFLNKNENFIDSDKSLFQVEQLAENNINCNENSLNLPSHYKKGTTGKELNKLNPQKICENDKQLVKKFLEKQSNAQYKLMLKNRQKLPAWNKMMDILDAIDKNNVVIIAGETGCGKSTQVPQFILDHWLFEYSKQEDFKHIEIICTQPRRLSAISVSERVAEERNDKIGNLVGYQIRLENKISALTRLTFCTIGILLRRLLSEDNLNSITHIIIDEVHERSEESDFLLMILKEIMRKRQDLKVILMSATINANLFSNYFGKVPVLEIPGRTYPVEQLFLEEIIERTDFVLEPDSQYCRKIRKKDEEELFHEIEYADVMSSTEAPPRNVFDENLKLSELYSRYRDYSKKTCKSLFLVEPMKINPELIETVLEYIVLGDHDWPKEGAILVFLPGLAEIQNVYDSLCDSSMFNPRSGKFILVPLHSTLSNEEQMLVFRKPSKGMRKIVLSTNIAETSVTIDDCVFVIDCGLMKEKRFDSNKNMESLELAWVSRANVQQRKGRAGRVMPGVSIHLFTSHRYENKFMSQPVPEIHRIPLEQVVLRIKTLPIFNNFNLIEVIGKMIDPPSTENILAAIDRLIEVGAIDSEHNLTPLGHHLSLLPVDCKIGKLMIFGAIFQCLDSVLTICACLSHKSPFLSPFNKREEAERKKRGFAILNSDHLTILNAYKKWNIAAKRSRYAGRCFAEENFLSIKTLETIADIKFQFLELLVSIGFVPIDLPPSSRSRNSPFDKLDEIIGLQLNSNGENNRLLISLLCCLYPNIVKVLTPEKTYTNTIGGALPKLLQASDLRFKTRQDGFVSIHPSSINSNCSQFISPFLVYQEKIKTSKIFIRECSMVSLIPLVFFSGTDMRIELHDGDFIILLENGWIMVKAQNHQVAEMIQCLRHELIDLLEQKIRDPCLNLFNHDNGKKIIATIIYLISRD